MSLAPPPAVEIEFEWRGMRLTTTVNQTRLRRPGPTGQGVLVEDEWVAALARDAHGKAYSMGVAISSGESVVRLRPGIENRRSPLCVGLLAMRPLPRVREVPTKTMTRAGA